MKYATASQTRQLRDGRQLLHVDECPYCQGDHWLIGDGSTLAYVPCGDNRPVWLDGLGSPVK